jgi:hypothetical protein
MADKGKRAGRGRRILGYVLTGLGILSIVDFFSPIPIPTVGASAFISGSILVGAGLFALYYRKVDWQGLFRRIAGRPRIGSEPASRPPIDPLVPVSILKLARDRGGILTVAMASMALEISLDIAEAGMEECVKKGMATPEYDEDRSTVTYRFPEFLPPPEPGGAP